MSNTAVASDEFGQYTTVAVQLHEVLTSFMAAGFTRPEAFDLVSMQWAEILTATFDD